ncbi:MAG: F0F1 ATP synthase subunit B [Patescibacteria group bacterium]
MIDLTHILHLVEAAAVEAAGEESKSGNVFQLLGINWKLFIAQLVNFGIILFVLWKWVFTPVTNALQNRTKKIEESLKDAEEIKRQVAQLEEFRKQQIALARNESDEILNKSRVAAADQKLQILKEARVQSEKITSDAEKRISAERSKILAEVKGELAGLVTAATEKILAEKLDKNKDRKLIKDSLNGLKR